MRPVHPRRRDHVLQVRLVRRLHQVERRLRGTVLDYAQLLRNSLVLLGGHRLRRALHFLHVIAVQPGRQQDESGRACARGAAGARRATGDAGHGHGRGGAGAAAGKWVLGSIQ